MSSEGGSFSYLGLHVGTDWIVRCSTYEAKAPILTIDAGPAAIAITLADRKSTPAAAAEFARALARQAQAFAGEVERIRAAQSVGQTADDGTGGGPTADNDSAAASGNPAAGSAVA